MKKPKLRLTPGLITNSWQLKLTALGLAILLWAAVRSEELTRFTMRDVPVEVRMAEPAWVPVGTPDPATVSVDFIGPVGELIRLAFAEATFVIPIEDVEDTLELYRPRAEWLEYEGRFEGLRVDEVRPPVLRLRFQPIESREVPVAVRLESELKPNVRLLTSRTDPARVRVEGPRDRVSRLDSLTVRVRDVDAALETGVARLPIDTAGLGVAISPEFVFVHLRATTDTAVAVPPVTGGAGRP